MPFDPNLPQAGTEIDAVQMRGQLNGLKDLIDAVPTITSAVIDSVTTGNPGDPASVSASIISGVLHLTFSLPRGEAGPQGETGQTGPVGPPFATAVVDGVTTLNPGDNATVSVTFDGTTVHFTFGIPRGNDGSQGIQGFQGPPGEVSNNDLNNAIAGTSHNSNAVSTIDTPFADPNDEALRVKLNELINALRR